MSAVDPIVVGTDGSSTAEHAVSRAGELGKALGAKLCVVNCYAAPTSSWMAAAGGIAVADAAIDTKNQTEAEQVVERATRLFEGLGVEAYGQICSGDPAQALLAVAEGEGAQMIVVGNRGMTGARRVLGSVPNSVSHQAKCAVLIVPTG